MNCQRQTNKDGDTEKKTILRMGLPYGNEMGLQGKTTAMPKCSEEYISH